MESIENAWLRWLRLALGACDCLIKVTKNLRHDQKTGFRVSLKSEQELNQGLEMTQPFHLGTENRSKKRYSKSRHIEEVRGNRVPR